MTRNQYLAVLTLIAGTVKEVGSGPSGPLYAALLTRYPGMSASEYQEFINTLIHAKAISESNRILTWLNDPKWNELMDAVDATITQRLAALQAQK